VPDTILGNTSTTATITVGGTSSSTVDTIGDHDWFKITLTAGQAVTISINGVTLSDPYLRVWDSTGNNLVKENDDYGSLNSQLSFVANYTGVYYIDVAAWADPQNPNGNYPGVTGDYQLNVTAFQTPPVYTNDQIATQLVSGYWGDGMHRFALDQTRTLSVNITGLTAQGQNLALQALQTWSQITGITFVQTTGVAQITFTDDDPFGGAFTDSTYSQSGNITSSQVNVDASWLQDYGPNVGGYAYQAYLHEVGHALGLGHAGNYNTTADYPYDALYSNDSWATSVMSYFSQTESSYFSNQGFTDAHDVTPMVADILAIGQLYGLSTTTRSGDTTYGFNSNAGSPYDASLLTNVAYTIFDTGGIDTLDYSQYSNNQTINLNPETFSNVGGERGNVSIARGTIIENAIGGSFKDVIIGNSVANVITGGVGVDTLTGGAGNDTFSDTKAGLNGDTITDFSAGDKIVLTDATLAGFTYSLSGSTLTYTGGSMTLSGISGTLVASAAAGGGVQLTIQQQIVQDVRNDFNGDGRSDILWRNDAGVIFNFLGVGSGGVVNNGDNSYVAVGSTWTVAGIGDFNGDLRDDILWRGSNGAMFNFLGTANGGFINNGDNSSVNVATSWQVAGIGDFNGDTKDDILWRNDAGVIFNFLGSATGNGGVTNNGDNSYVAVDASVAVAGIGDFNGDGKDDILWRNGSGTIFNFLGTANGGFVNNGNNSAATIGTDWHVAGIGDFNGDGKDDILWRNDNGAVYDFLGTGTGGFTSNGNNSFATMSNAWHVAEIGDFNGDTRDDILWRNDNGTIINWLGTANGGFTDNSANSFVAVSTTWHLQSPDILF
jgi:serralysin